MQSKVFFLTLLLFTVSGCATKQSGESVVIQSDIPFEISDDKTELDKYYQVDFIKEWYPERVSPPELDYNVKLENKTAVELWLLRNEIFARNGYLFDEAVLRGYFSQFKWYQPVFDVPEFKVKLTEEEADLVNRILKLEQERSVERYVSQGEYKMVNYDHVLNTVQFKVIPDDLKKMLQRQNFAIAESKRAQLFYVYDENHYGYIPNFITTDLYLQVLHMHFSNLLQNIEEEKLIGVMKSLLTGLHQDAMAIQSSDELMAESAAWAAAYLTIAAQLTAEIPGESEEGQQEYTQQATEEEMAASEEPAPPLEGPESYQAPIDEELEKIISSEGRGSEFLGTRLLEYSQFKPRGNYTKSAALKSYFRCVKWLNTAPVYIDSDQGMLSAAIIAALIKRTPEYKAKAQTFNNCITMIAGDEDNASFATLMALLSDAEAKDPALLANAERLAALRGDVMKNGKDRIKPAAGNDIAASEFSRPSLRFSAGRYSLDAEIISRLVHVKQPAKRPFPKGLDVFAALGNTTAEDILMTTYNEPKQWPAYTDSLSKLKKQFNGFSRWNDNFYTRMMSTIQSVSSAGDNNPLFMLTPSWKKKELVTSLATWTELKHDMILYSEQSFAAQAGEGGGPPPPIHLSYVEPNLAFWENCIGLLDFQQSKLEGLGLLTDKTAGINHQLKDLAIKLADISKKELARTPLTNAEFDDLTWIGGTIENLTFTILDTDHLPSREEYIALVADIFQNNGTALEEATGFADEIYVVVEINGKPYLSRGAVFSYYEFTSARVLTDEEWKAQILSGSIPPRPVWTKDITIKNVSLESKPGYSF